MPVREHGRLVLSVQDAQSPGPDNLLPVPVNDADDVQGAETEEQIARPKPGVTPPQGRIRQHLNGVGVGPIWLDVGLERAIGGESLVADRLWKPRQIAQLRDVVAEGELPDDVAAPVYFHHHVGAHLRRLQFGGIEALPGWFIARDEADDVVIGEYLEVVMVGAIPVPDPLAIGQQLIQPAIATLFPCEAINNQVAVGPQLCELAFGDRPGMHHHPIHVNQVLSIAEGR